MAQQESPQRNPFATEPASDLPVGVQLNWRLRALILSGRLSVGDSLPSVRQLAEWAKVNVNTVRNVYAALEREGLVVSRQGHGTFVAEGVVAAPQLERIAADALHQAREAGLNPQDLTIVTNACASISPDDGGGSDAASASALNELADRQSEAIEVRNELRRQIGRLEAELSSYVRDLPLDMPTAHRMEDGRVLTVDELEQTRDILIDKLSVAQKAAEQRAREEGRARARREKVLKGGQPPTAEQPPGGPLGKAMHWWRSKS